MSDHDSFKLSKDSLPHPILKDTSPNIYENLSVDEKAAKDKKLLLKLDLYLVPWLCLLYLTAFLDRSNIGNAKIDGIKESLDLSTSRFNATLSIFFVSYSLAEPFTNVLLKRMKPSIFIPITMILWGICMTLMGLVTNWSGLMTARWFLGLAEAGLFPGITYYLSCWYKRSELGIRLAVFFSAAAVSGSFGGLLAAAISKMDGLGNRPGWAWIFILEGVLTVLLGFISFWGVKDFPEDATFLCSEDRAYVIYRLQVDGLSTAEYETFDIKYFWMALKDYKTWLGMVIFSGIDMPLYAFSLFLPSIINELGYSLTTAQLLTVPPYAMAALLTIFVGWVADRTRQRGLCNMLTSILGMIGFTMLLASSRAQVKYAGTFLGALGIYPCVPNTISWISNNTEGTYKRAIVLGFVVGCGNLTGIISSNIYFKGPKYTVGHATVLGFMTVFLFGGSFILRFLLQRENRLRRKNFGMIIDGSMADSDPNTVEDLGDNRPDFIYIL